MTPHQPPCRRGADAQLGGCFDSIAVSERRSFLPPAKKKRWVGHERSRHDPHARQPSCRPRAMRAGSARLHGQSWRGSSVPTSAWPNSHGRAGDRLERPTLCPAPSTPLTISRWSLTVAGHATLLATRPSRAAVTTVAHLVLARARLLISRVGDALCDPRCIRSGSLTGSPGGCHCVRRGSNFEILNGKNPRMGVVTTAVPSADVASDASRRH